MNAILIVVMPGSENRAPEARAAALPRVAVLPVNDKAPPPFWTWFIENPRRWIEPSALDD
jgi:hypothetical protein